MKLLCFFIKYLMLLNIYLFIPQAYLIEEEGECFLLRIHEKLPRKVKKGDKRASLEGFKKIHSCKNEIEHFESQPLVFIVYNRYTSRNPSINFACVSRRH